MLGVIQRHQQSEYWVEHI